MSTPRLYPSFTGVIHGVLLSMRQSLHKLKDGHRVERVGISGAITGDEELAADRALGEIALAHLGSLDWVHSVEIEGMGSSEIHPDGDYDVKVDPLDSSLSYKLKGRMNSLLPYGGVITVLKRSEQPKFSDICAAGVMSFSSGEPDLWISMEGQPTMFNGQPACPYQGELCLTNGVVIAEMYYPPNRERITRAFRNQPGYLRNPGCSGMEMACVSSGQAMAYICMSQKAHELGAAYLIVKNAGGIVTDWSGKSLNNIRYDFNRQYPVIMAANGAVSEWILDLLRQ
jgi:fructose-1,6-bisphosphatase/inositol monophosphatase family enzyme